LYLECPPLSNDRKVALITGVTGQDGAYLAQFLLDNGYEVHAIWRQELSCKTDGMENTDQNPRNPDHRMVLHHGDLTDTTNLLRIVQEARPHELYNLAAQSHVADSFESPEYTANSDAIGTLRLLEAIRILGLEKHTRFYQASTSELYGMVREAPQRETTPFRPRTPCAAAALYGYWITVTYRNDCGMHASNGIVFSHESPLRGETFVTRKITSAAAAIRHGRQEKLYLGNLDAKGDLGHPRDYVRGMWLTLQQAEPDDYVLATGETTEVREFARWAFEDVGIPIEFRGEGVDEKGYCQATGRVLIEVDPSYYRPTEVDLLVGDPSKAHLNLGWRHETPARSLAREMVAADLEMERDGRSAA
jgi:GDPmannose 4,6-dehydratase